MDILDTIFQSCIFTPEVYVEYTFLGDYKQRFESSSCCITIALRVLASVVAIVPLP